MIRSVKVLRMLMAGLAIAVVILVAGGLSHVPAGAAEQTVTITWGPYTVPGGTEGMPGSTNNYVDSGVQMPCTDCYITGIVPNLVYADGSTAGQENMAMLHHMVALAYPTPDPTCGTAGFPYNTVHRLFASGDERTGMSLPSGYGVYNPPGAAWYLVVDIMNMMPDPRDMYLQFTFTYHPTSDNLTPVMPVWLDVNNCATSEFDAASGYSDTHWDWTSTLTGDIIGIGGHVHDYGIGVSAERVSDGASICSSVAGYGMGSPYAPAMVPDGDASHPGSVNMLDPGNMEYMGHIEDMTGCGPYFRINSGDVIRLHARYNPPAPAPGVMGIMVAYIHETTDPVPDADTDTVRDELDNCPNWPNASQTMPPWTVSSADPDCDGFGDTRESFVGTEPDAQCAATSDPNDETAPDTWPVDFNDDQLANINDVTTFSSRFNSLAPGPPYDKRHDFNMDGRINISDVTQYSQYFNKSCAP